MHQILLVFFAQKVFNNVSCNLPSIIIAVGEPPLCMSSSVLYAAKRAIESARHDMGNDQPFELRKFSFTSLFTLCPFTCSI